MSEEEAGTPVARSAPGTDGLWNTQVSWGQGPGGRGGGQRVAESGQKIQVRAKRQMRLDRTSGHR